MGATRGPLYGARLEYEIRLKGISQSTGNPVATEGSNLRVLMKEAHGNWLGLSPLYPSYGQFSSGPSSGKTYTKRSGFRYKSFKLLLLPGTGIIEPAPDKDVISFPNTISIGFPAGSPGAGVTVWRIIEFCKSSKQKDNIIGIVTPSGSKHQWKGKIGSKRISRGGDSGGLGGLLEGNGNEIGGLLGGVLGGSGGSALGSAVGGLLFG